MRVLFLAREYQLLISLYRAVLACCSIYCCRTSVPFFPKKIVVLTKLMFISLVLFQFGCFAMSVKSMHSGPTVSCVNCAKCWSDVCPIYAFIPS